MRRAFESVVNRATLMGDALAQVTGSADRDPATEPPAQHGVATIGHFLTQETRVYPAPVAPKKISPNNKPREKGEIFFLL